MSDIPHIKNMRKAKTSKKRKKSEMKSLKTQTPFTSKELKNPELVIETLFDCIKTQDLDTFREVLVSHLMTLNKTEISRKTGIGRRTLYDLMDPKKKFNPELTTLSSLIHTIAA